MFVFWWKFYTYILKFSLFPSGVVTIVQSITIVITVAYYVANHLSLLSKYFHGLLNQRIAVCEATVWLQNHLG